MKPPSTICADDAERQQHAEPREVAAERPPAPRQRARGDRGEADEARDHAVAVLDPGVRLQRRRDAAVALGPVRAAEARAGEAHRGAREDDQRQRSERHLGDALVGAGGERREPAGHAVGRLAGDRASASRRRSGPVHELGAPGLARWHRAARVDDPHRARSRRPASSGRPPTPMPQRKACTEAASTGASSSGCPGTPPDSGRALTSRTAACCAEPRSRAASRSSSAEPNCTATTAPTAAIASRPATREIALLAPLATPALCCGTAPSDGVGQRRHRHREAEAEQQHGRQQVGDEVDVGGLAAHPDQAQPADQRPGAHQRARADAGPTSAPKRRESTNMITVTGISVTPAATARVAGDLLEVDGDEERRRAEPGVDEQRRRVADREVARAEDAERQHRVGRPALVEDERDEQRGAEQPRQVHDRVAEAVGRLLDQREHEPGEPEPDEQRAEVVDAVRGLRVDRLGDRRAHERERRQHERHVDGEDPAPRRVCRPAGRPRAARSPSRCPPTPSRSRSPRRAPRAGRSR